MSVPATTTHDSAEHDDVKELSEAALKAREAEAYTLAQANRYVDVVCISVSSNVMLFLELIPTNFKASNWASCDLN